MVRMSSILVKYRLLREETRHRMTGVRLIVASLVQLLLLLELLLLHHHQELLLRVLHAHVLRLLLLHFAICFFQQQTKLCCLPIVDCPESQLAHTTETARFDETYLKSLL